MAKTKEKEREAGANQGAGAGGQEATRSGADGSQSRPPLMAVWTQDAKYNVRIGIARRNGDGSMNLWLNALPFTRKLRIVQSNTAESSTK